MSTGCQVARLRAVRWTRGGDKPDPTAYHSFAVNPHDANWLLTHVHWEMGEKGRGGRWDLRIRGMVKDAVVGTRYSKGSMP